VCRDQMRLDRQGYEMCCTAGKVYIQRSTPLTSPHKYVQARTPTLAMRADVQAGGFTPHSAEREDLVNADNIPSEMHLRSGVVVPT